MSALRWFPAAVLLVAMIAVLAWTATQPIEDMKASIIGFFFVTILCVAAVPALHLAIDS